MSKFQPSALFLAANKLVAPLIRRGLPIGVKRAPMALLTVRGRKSGLPRTTPVALAAVDDGWLLIAVYGVCDWSQNLEAAGEAEVTRRGGTTKIEARRLPPQEAAPLLRQSIADAPALVRRLISPYFKTDLESARKDWEREAVDHPVFFLTPI